MTKRMYSEDPYKQSFEAVVEKIEGNNVWLDQTCFYPESGGQAGDAGTLNGQRVVGAQFDTEKNIVHILESTPTFKIGDQAKGQIDWERRYKIMRVHAASHIMEHFLFQVFGSLKLTGSHLNEKYDKSTYESDERLDPEKIAEVEKRANEFIAQGLTIETWPDEKRPHFKYWKCGPIQMPCGGTHPKNTGEIGPIKLKRETGGRGREKVETSLLKS
ncbi:alanyl-tRNA editing protein [Patescibacteria group bacterium]|nr:alanyl-tRNA editing protein [Patescibacteria group bacterium]